MAASPANADCPLYRLPTSRFGVDLNPEFGRITDYDVAAMHLSWYSDWSSSVVPLRPGGIEYVQLIWVYQGQWSIHGVPQPWDVLERTVDRNPGAVWLIGNEPECPNYPGGGRMTPEQYAAVYHELHGFIKGRDPTARIAPGGVVEPTPLRLKWLDRLLNHYQATYGVPMPVDIWTTHVLILPEMSPLCPVEVCGPVRWGAGVPVGLPDAYGALYGIEDNWSILKFQQLVVAFCTWLRDRGQRDKPLWITEYGVLMPPEYGATNERVNAFMNASFDFMLYTRDSTLGYAPDSNLLVQRWAWNSLNDQPYNLRTGEGFNGGLFDYRHSSFPGTPTAFGLNLMQYTSNLLSGSACLSARAHLETRPAAPHASHVTTTTVTLIPVDCPQPDIRRAVTNEWGVLTLCNVLPWTYDVIVKGYNTLSNRVNGVELAAGTTQLDVGRLRSGDANNDDCVTILDFSILATAYGTAVGEPGYDARADFNGNGRIEILDFSLLATHFAECGAMQGLVP